MQCMGGQGFQASPSSSPSLAKPQPLPSALEAQAVYSKRGPVTPVGQDVGYGQPPEGNSLGSVESKSFQV